MDTEFAAALRSGENLVANWLSIGHPKVAEINGLIDFDFVVIDIEHTSNSLETVENLVRSVDYGSSPAAIVRVPWNDPVEIKRVLDIGVAGVMVPMVETAEEARAAVEAMRYPPEGIRGLAGGRASAYGTKFDEYVSKANDELVTIIQIETKKAVENAAEIAAVEGVDALFVGPSDLSASLGVVGQWGDQKVLDAMNHVLSVAGDEDVPVGSLAVSEEDVDRWMELGFDWLIVGTDTRYLLQGGQAMKDAFDSALDTRDAELPAED
ncbi:MULTISPECIES: HpcH/HpaI aldolase/citrate lyase family protein [unclassified Haladaptatus]|uniref:HpcH/HpaI aldolase family protein n=1 Tax=unclassified Haladaptatus TaxID=2622732 RepID=UPI0023E81150|nr:MULTISPECIES: aldolase/citrate lyase family protein [unclassified Haladaptatus]